MKIKKESKNSIIGIKIKIKVIMTNQSISNINNKILINNKVNLAWNNYTQKNRILLLIINMIKTNIILMILDKWKNLLGINNLMTPLEIAKSKKICMRTNMKLKP